MPSISSIVLWGWAQDLHRDPSHQADI